MKKPRLTPLDYYKILTALTLRRQACDENDEWGQSRGWRVTIRKVVKMRDGEKKR